MNIIEENKGNAPFETAPLLNRLIYPGLFLVSRKSDRNNDNNGSEPINHMDPIV